MFTAFVRKPGLKFSQAISEHPQKVNIDLPTALRQHQCYVNTLKEAGGKVEFLPPKNHLPDATFVEDTAVVLEDKILLCPMQEPSRQEEVQFTATALKKLRDCVTLSSPASLDGGDVMITPNTIFVGLSKRTNSEAVKALSKLTSKKVVPVEVTEGLHLKSATTFLGNNLLILDPCRIDTTHLKQMDWIEVSQNESYAANCLALGNGILMPAGFQNVSEKIRAHGFKTFELEMSEFEKANGGVTCLSLIIPTP
ncbi:MAG: arginine deiminase family protein [Nitrospinaceae bacterium]|jgi:dimethylargininase